MKNSPKKRKKWTEPEVTVKTLQRSDMHVIGAINEEDKESMQQKSI